MTHISSLAVNPVNDDCLYIYKLGRQRWEVLMTADEVLAIEIHRLINGFHVSQAIHVAATLGIADKLAQGARANDELALATGTHAPSLYRLLRALASMGVLRDLDDQRFELTPLGESLRSDVTG